ncbi:MAG: thermonuclease family protein [Syntrophomonas sp.]|nr:thermonuclease family protein [Syntrophomonas sp.]
MFVFTKNTALIILAAVLTLLAGCISVQTVRPGSSGYVQQSNEQPTNYDTIKPDQDGPGVQTSAVVPEGLKSAIVSRVIDGDTIVVVINNTTEKVRLIGVDTPETVHPTIGGEFYGQQASDYTKSKLSNQSVGLELDVEERDRYGRMLAYVWLGDQMFNEVLLREGYAQLATFPPNVKYVERFTAVQKEARQQQRGFWGEH